MFCPNYKIKEVKYGFNEIIEALGGKPLTDEEFRSSELRDKRTGDDYSAMEAAYKVYHRNNGNLLDMTPDGKPSILFQTLLDHFGNRKDAIIAKSNVYSDEFFNWFGDWTGTFNSEQLDEETKKQISLIFKRIPKLSEIGTEEQYAKYIQTIFPKSQDKSIYWHGSNSDFSEGFKSAKRGEGSGAPETKKRNDFYLAKQAWSVLQYVNGINRKSVDKNGFSHWNKLWWEFKEIMSNGRRENNDWKDLIINEENVRQAIPNKKGVFNRDKGGNNGKWLKERKADYGYENKSDKEFFEEILGVKWGEDTFNTWTKRNEEIFKSLQETEKGIYPAIINTQNPIRESGQNTYYEEDRGLFTQADTNNNDAILSSKADNEFNSDIAVILRDNERIHFLGTEDDIESFKKFIANQLVSKVVDSNGEPLVVWHGSNKDFSEFEVRKTRDFLYESDDKSVVEDIYSAFFFSSNKQYSERYSGGTVDQYLSDEEYEQRFNVLNKRQETLRKRRVKLRKLFNSAYGDPITKNGFNPFDENIPQEILDEFNKWLEKGDSKEVQDKIKKYDKIDAELADRIDNLDKEKYKRIIQKPAQSVLYPVYLNIKRDITNEVSKFPFIFAYQSSSRDFFNESNKISNTNFIEIDSMLAAAARYFLSDKTFRDSVGLIGRDRGSVYMDAEEDNIQETHTGFEYAVFNPNQIKHVANLGTWNPANPNIYHVSAKPNTTAYKLESVQPNLFFGETYSDLLNGKAVSTQAIIQNLINTDSFSNYNQSFAEIAQKHNIPVVFSTLPYGKPMATVENKDGSVVIEIDEQQISKYTTETASEYLLHEVVHALSVKAIRNPITVEEQQFSTATKKIYDTLDKLMPESEWNRASMESGAYILSDVYEFAAVFATDKDAKYMVYQRAIEEDRKGNNKLFLRLKQFINALSRLLLNKNTFKGIKSDQLKLYEKQLNRFLLTRKVDTVVNPTELFNDILNNTYNPAINDQQTAILRERLLRYQANAIRHFITTTEQQTDATKYQLLWRTRVKIAEALETRLAAINSSIIDDDLKLKSKQVVETQLSQFKNKSTSTVAVLQSFLQQTLPQLLDDVDSIRNIDESSHSYYMYNMHDNFGAYAAIFNMLSVDIKNAQFFSQLQEEFKSITTVDKLSITRDINDIASVINEAAATAQDGVRYMYNILLNNVRRDLAGLSEEINYGNTQQFLDSIDSIGFDTNAFIDLLGSKDGAQDPLIRSIVYLINKAMRQSKKQVVPVATRLLKLKNALQPGESVLDLYELDGNGKTTQFLVRSLNFGKFYNDYRQFQESLNKKYGLPEGNRTAPDNPDIRRNYNIDKNNWLAEHCERRFLPKYYEAYANLSDDTLAQLNSIRTAISAIKELAYDKNDKIYHYDKLSEDEWDRLQGLYIQKRVLASDYTMYGDLKIEGTDEYRWAKELQRLNNTLYNRTDQEIKYATNLWNEARNKVIQKAIKDNTADGNVNASAVRRIVEKWDERNSKRIFKSDGENLLIFKTIQEETEREVGFSEPVYEYKGDGGNTYENNKKRINEIINLFRDYNTGEPNLTIMPARVKSILKKLEEENKKIRKEATKGNRELIRKSKTYRKTYRKIFKKYLKTEYTSYYKKLHRTGDISIIDSEDTKVIKHRWETILKIKPGYDEDGISFKEKFSNLIPGDGWINRDENDQLLNPVYKELKMNVPYIPKKVLKDGSSPYDNSKHYNKIQNSPTLKALYEALVGNNETGQIGILQEANQKRFNRLYQDDYLLPGVTGSMWKYMKNQGIQGAVTSTLSYVGDHLGFTQQGIAQDQSFGQAVNSALETVNDLYEIVNQDEQLFGGKATGVRPDGRQFNIIPQYYSKRLDDPSQLSSDLIGIVCSYYENSCNFENKSNIKDYVESILDVIQNRRYEILNNETGNREIKEGKSTRTFKSAKKFVEMNLYNIRTFDNKIGLNVGDTRYNMNLGKTAQNFSRLTQALNLGMSPAVALTGFFTAQYTHLINAIVGDRGYGMNEWTQAAGESIGHFIKNYAGIQYVSNQQSNDKVMLLAEYFDVSNQLKRKFKNSNRNRFVRFLDNWCFGMLTSTDFASKSTIMIATLMGHHYVDGKFLSKEDVLNKLEASTKEGRDILLKKWESGKNLYSIFSTKNGELVIDEQYKHAFELSENTIYNRITKTAENADGMATETQKAAITTNFFGAAVLTHRQYLPLMIQQRFLPMVYDFDMQMYTQGQYIIDAQFFKNVIISSMVQLIKAKSIQDAIDTFKEEYNKFTNDASTEESWKISRARKKALKKTITELTMFTTTVIPLVGLICMFADMDDNKDELALQLAAYIARRVEWEVFTPYRMSDIFNNIKSPSAQTGTIDKFANFTSQITKRIMPQGTLLDTLLGLDQKVQKSDIIMRGVYEGHSRLYRAMMQMTPYHNLYEQWYGSKQKRNYYEKQIMQIDD